MAELDNIDHIKKRGAKITTTTGEISVVEIDLSEFVGTDSWLTIFGWVSTGYTKTSGGGATDLQKIMKMSAIGFIDLSAVYVNGYDGYMAVDVNSAPATVAIDQSSNVLRLRVNPNTSEEHAIIGQLEVYIDEVDIST